MEKFGSQITAHLLNRPLRTCATPWLRRGRIIGQAVVKILRIARASLAGNLRLDTIRYQRLD